MKRGQWGIEWHGATRSDHATAASHAFGITLNDGRIVIRSVICEDHIVEDFIAAEGSSWDKELASIALCAERIKLCDSERGLYSDLFAAMSTIITITLEQSTKLKNGKQIFV